nr:alpha-glucan family phosphorylase [Maliibacterium massiliense]
MNKRVAYFCMEFGLHEDFPIYSGGLGILAGDILKAAHDLDLPMVGVGILWRQGYVNQRIDAAGKPYDSYYERSYPFLTDTGVVVDVPIRGRNVQAKVWCCTAFDNVPLYLLDTFIPGNNDMLLTGQLYGWFSEERLAQELILGVGGLRALEALGIQADIIHFNDSHPVVAGLEMVRMRMQEGLSFEEALRAVRPHIVFTTHTPVLAGNERYDLDILRYMGVGAGLTDVQMEAIGGKPFGMTVAGLRLAKRANAVAQLHGQTARKMWAHVQNAAEIDAITNGVHNATWQDARMRADADDQALARAHADLKGEMIALVQRRAGVTLSPDILTVGFARRAAPYKRSDLIFRRPEVVAPWLRAGKLQIVFSGKAHPNDYEGKAIVANLVGKSRQYPGSVVFVEDYDMQVGKALTRGCDVWLNNPVRPMEASGTSGMKAAMNGVLNVSVLDGWWPEGCADGVNGWAIGDGYEGPDCDAVDMAALYAVLGEKVIPTYYHNRAKWHAMMRASIAMASERFSAARMLREYYARLYQA